MEASGVFSPFAHGASGLKKETEILTDQLKGEFVSRISRQFLKHVKELTFFKDEVPNPNTFILKS